MKITHVHTQIVRLPADEPLAGGPEVAGATRDFVALTLGTDQGIEGIGITQWLKIAGMAQAFNLPVVSHLVPEIHVHLIAAIPNGLTVEYMPWSARLFREVPLPQKGELVVPARPGLGLEFDRNAFQRYGVGA